MTKKTITQGEKMQLLGLLTLGMKHQAIVNQVEEELASITESEVGDHLSDAIYSRDMDIDKILGYMGIEVEDATT